MQQLNIKEFRQSMANALSNMPVIITRYDKPVAIVVPFDERLLGVQYDSIGILLKEHIAEVQKLLDKHNNQSGMH